MSFLMQTTQVIAEHTQVISDTGQQVVEHAAHSEHASHSVGHAVNWVTLLAEAIGNNTFLGKIFIQGEKIIFSAIVIFIIAFLCHKVSRRIKLIPEKPELFLESIVVNLDELVCGIIGIRGRVHTPFVGALFIYILISNLYGLLPLQNSSTAYVTTTSALGLSVFFYVQFFSLLKNGLVGYIKHLAGNPDNLISYFLIPINFPLHILGELTKPITLMFRLYGNMMAGHILVAVFLGMGINVLKSYGIPFGIPMHFPFLFLELLVSIIQAFVFALLASIYIGAMLPHHEHEHHPHEHDHLQKNENELEKLETEIAQEDRQLGISAT